MQGTCSGFMYDFAALAMVTPSSTNPLALLDHCLDNLRLGTKTAAVEAAVVIVPATFCSLL